MVFAPKLMLREKNLFLFRRTAGCFVLALISSNIVQSSRFAVIIFETVTERGGRGLADNYFFGLIGHLEQPFDDIGLHGDQQHFQFAASS